MLARSHLAALDAMLSRLARGDSGPTSKLAVQNLAAQVSCEATPATVRFYPTRYGPVELQSWRAFYARAELLTLF